MMKKKPLHLRKCRNRYKYHFDKQFTKEEILNYFGDGWSNLIENAFKAISWFPSAQIYSAKRCLGMLHIYIRSEDEFEENAAQGVCWKIERLSATICEHCGTVGKRRKELITIYCLCESCYIKYLDSHENPEKLFMKKFREIEIKKPESWSH